MAGGSAEVADIDIPGISSKYNTASLVEDLVATERIKLDRMEETLSSLERDKTVWRRVNRALGNLQRTAKSLYGFENPFSDKLASSSNEQILTALASRNAPIESYSITIKQVATSDRFISPSLDKAFRVDAGDYRFRIGDESLSFRYRGGTLEDFSRRLTDKGEGFIRAATVRDTSDTLVMVIEAIPTGAENKLVFEDDAVNLGLKVGVIEGSRARLWEVSLESVFKNLESDAASDRLKLSEEGMTVGPNTSVRLPFEEEVRIESGLVLEYKYRIIEPDEEGVANPLKPRPAAPENHLGKVSSNPIPGNENSGKEGEIREILKAESGSGNFSLPPIDFGKVEDLKVVRVEASGLPENIRAIVLDNSDSDRSVEIADIRIYNPKKLENFEPVNPSSRAGDAIIEFMGIEARRPGNSIDDLIDGLTLNVKRPSSEPIELSISPDVETAKEGIIRFVFNYNQLITRISVLTNDDQRVIDELEYLDDEEREDLESLLGYMRGENALTQLKSQLQSIVSNPYPTRVGVDLSLLAHIGISTNASSGNTSAINFSKLRGYLEIDEEKLERSLETDIDAIKELFGKDTSGDLVIDSGVASAIDSYLTPYVRSGGFVSNRIARIDGQIDNAEEDISNYEQYLEDYEADLRRQYGNMEAILNQLENSSRELENFASQQNNKR